jgi:hypothetical protein
MAKKQPTTPAVPPKQPQAIPPTEPAAAQDAGQVPPEAEQPAEPPTEPSAPAPDEPVTQEQPAADPVPELEDYIAQHEAAAQDAGLVVTAITHPTAKPRMHPGVYSGFPISTGPLSATYSDGSTH